MRGIRPYRRIRVCAAQLGSASAQRGLAAARAERIPTVTTFNAYTWLNNTPAFKSSVTLPGSSAPLNLTFPFLNRDFFFGSTLMNVPLYTGGRIRSGIDAASAQSRSANAEEFTAAMDLKLQVAEAYLSVLRVEKLLLVARSNVTSLQAHERDAKNLFKEGVGKRTDVLASQVSLAKARQRVIQVRNELEVARAAYNRLLARPLGTTSQLEEMALRTDFGLGSDKNRAGTDRPPGAIGLADQDPDTDAVPEAEIEQLTATALNARSELAGLSQQARAFAAQARFRRVGQEASSGIHRRIHAPVRYPSRFPGLLVGDVGG